MGRIILGIILLAFLAINGYYLYQAATYPDRMINWERDSITYVHMIYIQTIAKAAIPIGGILADMLLVIILNFMDAGWRERKRKRVKRKAQA